MCLYAVAIVCVTLVIIAGIAAGVVYVIMKAKSKRTERGYDTQLDEDEVDANSIAVVEGQVLDVIDGNDAEQYENTDIEL